MLAVMRFFIVHERLQLGLQGGTKHTKGTGASAQHSGYGSARMRQGIMDQHVGTSAASSVTAVTAPCARCTPSCCVRSTIISCAFNLSAGMCVHERLLCSRSLALAMMVKTIEHCMRHAVSGMQAHQQAVACMQARALFTGKPSAAERRTPHLLHSDGTS